MTAAILAYVVAVATLGGGAVTFAILVAAGAAAHRAGSPGLGMLMGGG